MAVIESTFTGTGTSDVIACAGGKGVNIGLNFGEGTVAIQMKIGKNWFTTETVTADYAKVFTSPVACAVRLNCTAHSSDISYAMDNT